MVSIPVRLYKAARRERIRFHNVYRPERVESEPEEDEPVVPERPPRNGPRLLAPTGPMRAADEAELSPVERVRSVPMAAPLSNVPAEPLPKTEILKAFELEKDRYVVFDPREIAAMRPRTSSELAIDEFVRLAEIDPVFFETSYCVAPEDGGEKPYALLFGAMAESGYAALGSFAMHGREHAAVVRPGRRGLILHTLFYATEVRPDAEYSTDASLVAPKERQLAVTLIDALAAPFDPSRLKNAQEERMRALIESRASSAVTASGADRSRPAAPPVDIMESLRKSLAAAKKPAARETRPAPAPVQTARRPRRK